MPQSFVHVPVHIVFSTKERIPLIGAEIEPRLFSFIGGICRNLGSTLMFAGGMPDHVHLLCSLSKERSLADVVRDIKANSSRWVHEEFPQLDKFQWQTGYAACGVSHSNVPAVKQYLATQREHHRTRTFQEEFVELLKRHNIDYDERYIWA